MGGARAASGGGGGAAAPKAAQPSSIPPSARQLVQNLKEIVGHSDEEIYATLKECSMDPNETAQRLISQVPFHEVKRKKDKKKEAPVASKEGFENRSRPSGPSRGGRGERGAGRGGGRNPANEYGNGRARPMVSKENGSQFASAVPTVPSVADHAPPKPPISSIGGGSPALPNGSVYAPVSQGAWSKPTMADILKSSTTTTAPPPPAPSSTLEAFPAAGMHTSSDPVHHPSDFRASSASNAIKREIGTVGNQRPIGDRVSSTPAQSQPSQEEEPALPSPRETTKSESVATEVLKSLPSPSMTESEELSVATKFESLSTREEQQVVMPTNFQSQNDLGLSFGSFGGEAYGSTLPSGFSSEDGIDISTSTATDSAAKEAIREQSTAGTEPAAPEVMNEVPVQIETRTDSSSTLSTSFPSQSDISKLRVQQPQQYSYLQSTPSYSTMTPQIPTSQHNYETTDSHLQDMTSVSSAMKQQHYTDQATSFYSPGFRPGADGDARYPQYLHSAAKYNNGAVVLPGQHLPLSQEVGNATGFSTSSAVSQANTHSLPTAPQQPLVHAYPAQPAGMPMGHFTTFSYPYPSYTLVPSPYQPSYNTSYPQPPVSSYAPSANYTPLKYPLPAYKPSTATANAPLAAASGGYGGYGSASSMYANPAATASNSSGYEDASGVQFKDSNLYLHPQGDRMWIQSQLSGDVAAAHTSSFYALSGQNQHTSYTQPSSHTHPMAGYTSLYHQPGGAHQLMQPQTITSGAAGSTQVGSTYHQQIQRMQQQQQQQQQHQQQQQPPNWNAY